MPFPNPQTQFKPGEVGYTDGRPADPITTLLRRALYRREADGGGRAGPNSRTVGEILVDALFRAAKNGNLKAVQIILDRTEGKPRRSVTLAPNEDTAPIHTIQVIREND